MAAEHRERVLQVLQRVAVDQAVDAVRQVERQRIAVDVDLRHFIHVGARDRGGVGVGFESEQAGGRVHPAIGGGEGAFAAADIQHDPGGERDAVEQVGVGVGRIGRHRRRSLPQ